MTEREGIAIERVEMHHIRLPYVHPFETSFARETHRESILVRIQAAGMSGWGECVSGSGPWYSYETVGTARHVMKDYLIPALMETTLTDPADTVALFGHVRGHGMARATLENALWDLFGRLRGQSLQTLLGGTGSAVAVGVSVGIEPTFSELEAKVAAHVEDEGYRRVKLKIKPGWDVDVVARIRARWPDLKLQVDANSAYTLKDAAVFRELDQFNLLLIEQPFHHEDMVDHAELQAQISTPVCLDESIHSPMHARWAIKMKACRNINIKVGRVGGLTAAREIHDMCQAAAMPVWCGGMLETNVGRAVNLALASLPNFSLPGDISASSRYFHRDVAVPDFELNPDSTVTLPQGPGTGVEIRPAWLLDATLASETIARG